MVLTSTSVRLLYNLTRFCGAHQSETLEYPAAMERNGPPSDTPNLTVFFKDFRAGLEDAILSLATPAGYWFLRGFELDKISPNLDMINMMSYDFRGSLSS